MHSESPRPRPRCWRLAVLLPLSLTLAACPALRRPVVPMPTQVLVQPEGPARCLVVLLPGIRDAPADFADTGFGDAVAARLPGVEVIAADAHLGYYRDRSVIHRLRDDILAPYRAAHPEATIWVGGVSLGGLGSLLLRRDHPELVDGVVALAPFLGDEEVVAELQAAGSLAEWTPPEPLDPTDGAREIWVAFQEELGAAEQLGDPPILLGWGRDDDFATADGLLGELLPADRVTTVAGGHDWTAWKALWDWALEREELASCAKGGSDE